MSESGTVTRGEHSALYKVRGDNVRITSEFGTLIASLEGKGAQVVAGRALALQIGMAIRKAADLDKGEAARQIQAEWQRKWAAATPSRWINRPPPKEVVEAVESGWLPASGTMVDLGCGAAEIAAWFAERGYRATGVDVAPAAVEQAAKRHAGLGDSIEFFAVDLCTETVPDRSFDILVDRGCLHQFPESLVGDYVRNIASMASPGARMMVFSKAFREGNPFGDPEETEHWTEWTRRAFEGHFELERAAPTYLNPENDRDPLPGMAFWLIRTG